MIKPDLSKRAEPRPPSEVRSRLERLQGIRRRIQRDREASAGDLEKVTAYLGLADSVDDALNRLGSQLFEAVVKKLEEMLSDALREVLEQPISLKVTRDHKRGSAVVSFHVERDGKPEDIMKG